MVNNNKQQVWCQKARKPSKNEVAVYLHHLRISPWSERAIPNLSQPVWYLPRKVSVMTTIKISNPLFINSIKKVARKRKTWSIWMGNRRTKLVQLEWCIITHMSHFQTRLWLTHLSLRLKYSRCKTRYKIHLQRVTKSRTTYKVVRWIWQWQIFKKEVALVEQVTITIWAIQIIMASLK